MSTNDQPLEAEGAKHASGRKSITLTKSPSLQLLRRLHQPVVGLNDVSISSDDGDWDSDPTVIHRRSVASSCRTSRCSSVMSTNLDWEEVQHELAAVSAEADGISDNETEGHLDPSSAPGRSRSPLRRQHRSPLADKPAAEAIGGQSLVEEEACYFDRHRGVWVKKDDPSARTQLANRIFVRNFSKSTTEQELQDFFNLLGTVSYIRLIKKKKNRQSPRRALIQFATDKDVSKVLEELFKSPFVLNDRKLVIEIAKPYKQRKYINDLPEEVLSHIFGFLSVKQRLRNECVCKRWRKVNLEGSWVATPEEIRHLIMTCKVMDRELNIVLERCGMNLKKLDLSQKKQGLFSYRATTAVAKHCQNLQEIDLGHVPITNYSLRSLAQSCNKLQSIIFESVDFDDKGLWWIAKYCRDLKYLSIKDCSNPIGSCFSELNKDIKGLHLVRCDLKPDAIYGLLHCEAIEELNFDSSDLGGFRENLYAVFQKTASTLKKLSFCQFNRDAVQDSFLSTIFPNLEELSMADNRYVTDEFVAHAAAHCTKLRMLNISGTSVTDISFHHLLDCSLLNDLDISRTYNIKDASVKLLALRGNLIRLNVAETKQISDDACTMLAQHCIHLSYLDIRKCRKITTATAKAFLQTITAGLRDTTIVICTSSETISTYVDLAGSPFLRCSRSLDEAVIIF